MTQPHVHLHFNLGPVQGFVAQARRTRDFWAGSFLLSYMAGVAMQAVRFHGGDIVFPKPSDDFINALQHGGQGPAQGGVPNRFTATVPDGFDPDQIIQTLQSVWQQLAEHVWSKDQLDATDETGETRRIWDQQIAAFWDITWVQTDGADFTALDRRKNWRSYAPPAQDGAKCMVMDGWRELSGGAMLPAQPRHNFWRDLRSRGRAGMQSDLAEGENLCAVAYVKRRFARYFSSFSADAGGWTAHGWPVPVGVPSVAFIAAARWLADVIAHSDEDLIEAFHSAVQALSPEYGEWDSNLHCIRDALNQRAGSQRKWKALDGSLLFPSSYDNAKLFPDKTAEREQAKKLLRSLREETTPSPFYAVLAMDGDRLGAMLTAGKQNAVSQALTAFTQDVPGVVQQNSGFLIYAGGDDVLALLPLDDALTCAAKLRRRYLEYCQQFGLNNASISAAIHYAHYRAPLGRILGDSHRLLDAIAKDKTGRNALAVRVSKPSGVACTWSMPWDEALKPDGDQVSVEQIAADFASHDADGSFSSKFFYRIREQLEQLNVKGSKLEFGDKVALMASRYLGSGVNNGREKPLTMGQAEDRVRPLLELCRTAHRDANGEIIFEDDIHADAALLVRFLAAKGLGREDAA